MVIDMQAIELSFDKKNIFHRADLKLSKGEAVGLLGANGSGKTTLFDLICSLRLPDRGKITNNSYAQSYLSQTLTPPPNLKMVELHDLISNLSQSLPTTINSTLRRLKKWSPELQSRYARLLTQKPRFCSYGEIRGFFTLTLLALGGDVMLLDEPTAGVDPEFRHYIWLGIRHSVAEGAAVLVSSHNISEIISNCHRFYMLANSKLTPFGTAEEYLGHYQASTLDEAFIKACQQR